MLKNSFALFIILIIHIGCKTKTSIYEQSFLELPKNISSKYNQSSFIEKAQIGHYLFFDKRLSINNSKSCASCHNPTLYCTDGYKQTLGLYADIQERNTPSIINSIYNKTLNWANPEITSIEMQMKTPLFSKKHFEMGMDENNHTQPKNIFESNTQYQKFPHCKNDKNKTWQFIIGCITNYVSLLNSRESLYDHFMESRDSTVLTYNQRQGMQLFFSNQLQCSSCHGGIDFNIPAQDSNYFSNNNFFTYTYYNSTADKGLANTTHNISDIGKYRIPSLRNCAKTAPYMHNGSIASLKEIINTYANRNSNNALLKGFTISENEKMQLLDFLETLTDTSIHKKLIFNNPYTL